MQETLDAQDSGLENNQFYTESIAPQFKVYGEKIVKLEFSEIVLKQSKTTRKRM